MKIFRKNINQNTLLAICAFLNGKGGTVLIGVNDKGELVGQDVSDNTRQEIAKELNKIDPPAAYFFISGC